MYFSFLKFCVQYVCFQLSLFIYVYFKLSIHNFFPRGVDKTDITEVGPGFSDRF